MFFKELLKIWQEDSLLSDAIKSTREMLQEGRQLVEISLDSLIKNEKFIIDVYKEDQRINHFEKDIRKKILEHLTINPSQDVAASLILLGVVRDIERVGDFAKNYFELNQLYKKNFEGKYADRLIDIKNKLLEMFILTQESFVEGDIKKAKKVIDWHYKEASVELNNITKEIMEDKFDEDKDAVAYALLSRYLKRSSAHLANIASSISNPFHHIGFEIRDCKEVEIKS